jgi:acetylornithine deacetylase
MTVEITLKDLVAFDSVSSRSNAEIIAYLKTRCEARGLNVRTYSHTDENGIEKLNLTATTSDDAEIQLALVGHTDTVPYDPNWNEALQLTERDGKLFGRGSCDTKAFIAAALTAIESIELVQLKKPLALVFTADEEIGCLGARRLANAKPFAARYAIVGEPTSLQPMRAGKGYCLAEVTVRGREAPQCLSANRRIRNFSRRAFDWTNRKHRRTVAQRSARRFRSPLHNHQRRRD